MAVYGPFKWNSHSFAVPQREWDYTCTITGFLPSMNMIQNQMAIADIEATPGSFANNVTGLSSFNDQTASILYIVAFAGTKGFTGPYTLPITFTDRTGAVTISSATKYSDILNAIFVAVGGGNAPIKLTSGASNFANLGGSPPSANLVKVVNNFMFLANAPGAVNTASRLYWSNVVDPETWSATSFVDVRKNDGYGITALGNIGTDLYVFKPTSISRFGTTNFLTSGSVPTLGPLETVNYFLGVTNGYNVCQMSDGRMAFLANDSNLYIYDGNSLFNASYQPFPGPDLRNFYFGASAGIADSIIWENPVEKAIYLFAPGAQSGLVYNYVENFWWNTVSYNGAVGGATANIYSMTSLPATSGQAAKLFLGTNNAIFFTDNASNSDNVCTATMTIRLPYLRRSKLPRVALFEFSTGGGASGRLRARAGINALPAAYGITNNTATTGRYLIPVVYTQTTSLTPANPSEQNVLVEVSQSATGTAIYGDVYLSDEIE